MNNIKEALKDIKKHFASSTGGWPLSYSLYAEFYKIIDNNKFVQALDKAGFTVRIRKKDFMLAIIPKTVLKKKKRSAK